MKKISNQHGDVVLQRVIEIPKEAKKIKVDEGFIVEKGEGIHTHILKKKSQKKVAVKDGISPLEMNSMMDLVEVYEKGEDMYIKVKETVCIDHEEHGIQTLEPGIYKKNIEREFDYENEIERRVLD